MAAFQALKGVGSGGAFAVVSVFLAGGFVFAGKKAVVAEGNGSKPNATDDAIPGLACAPQFDGLECFETIVSTGKHPRLVKQPMATENVVPRNLGVTIAPQFDGLYCFETFVSKR